MCKRRDKASLDFAVFFTPRRTIACERALQEAGVYGDAVVGEYPLGFIPLDADVLSLEHDGMMRVRLYLSQPTIMHNFKANTAVEHRGWNLIHWLSIALM